MYTSLLLHSTAVNAMYHECVALLEQQNKTLVEILKMLIWSGEDPTYTFWFILCVLPHKRRGNKTTCCLVNTRFDHVAN